MNYPRWQACGACSVLIISAMLFTTSIIGSYKNTNIENPILSISAGHDKTVNVGMVVEFNGQVTTDTDISKLNCTWVFHDHPNTPAYDYKLNSTRVFSKEGVYSAEFIVKDSAGNKYNDSINITVKRGLYIQSIKWNVISVLPSIKVNVTTTISNAGVRQTDNITVIVKEQNSTNNQKNVTQSITLNTNETRDVVTTMEIGINPVPTFSATLYCNDILLDSKHS